MGFQYGDGGQQNRPILLENSDYKEQADCHNPHITDFRSWLGKGETLHEGCALSGRVFSLEKRPDVMLQEMLFPGLRVLRPLPIALAKLPK